MGEKSTGAPSLQEATGTGSEQRHQYVVPRTKTLRLKKPQDGRTAYSRTQRHHQAERKEARKEWTAVHYT